MRTHLLLPLALAAVSCFGQYKAEPGGAPPAEVPATFAAKLQKQGTKILDAKGTVVEEIWLVAKAPSGPKTSETNVTLTTVPHGSLLGVIRFPAQGGDRRGQTVKPGVYTMRYSMFPISGDHQGIAPQRDFAVLSRIADEGDPSTTPAFEPLMGTSKKASGTSHPLVLSIWKADDSKADFSAQGEGDWVLQRQLGDTWIDLIVIGKTAA